jgi:hypothetical protein
MRRLPSQSRVAGCYQSPRHVSCVDECCAAASDSVLEVVRVNTAFDPLRLLALRHALAEREEGKAMLSVWDGQGLNHATAPARAVSVRRSGL